MPTWLTGTEAIKHCNIGRATFYRLVKEGRITAYTLPGMQDPRYRQEELDALFTPAPKEETGEKEEG